MTETDENMNQNFFVSKQNLHLRSLPLGAKWRNLTKTNQCNVDKFVSHRQRTRVCNAQKEASEALQSVYIRLCTHKNVRSHQWSNNHYLRSRLTKHELQPTWTKRNLGFIVFVINLNNVCTVYSRVYTYSIPQKMAVSKQHTEKKCNPNLNQEYILFRFTFATTNR